MSKRSVREFSLPDFKAEGGGKHLGAKERSCRGLCRAGGRKKERSSVQDRRVRRGGQCLLLISLCSDIKCCISNVTTQRRADRERGNDQVSESQKHAELSGRRSLRPPWRISPPSPPAVIQPPCCCCCCCCFSNLPQLRVGSRWTVAVHFLLLRCFFPLQALKPRWLDLPAGWVALLPSTQANVFICSTGFGLIVVKTVFGFVFFYRRVNQSRNCQRRFQGSKTVAGNQFSQFTRKYMNSKNIWMKKKQKRNWWSALHHIIAPGGWEGSQNPLERLYKLKENLMLYLK